METAAFEMLKMVGGEKEEEEHTSKKLSSARPKRLILLTAFVMTLLFIVVVLNIVLAFIGNLTENEDFLTQLSRHLRTNYTHMCDREK